jgi:integrase/recombinase XerD
LSAVKSWFKFLIAKGVIKSFPSEDLVSPKVNKAMPHFLSPAQIQAVLKQPEKYPTPEGKRDKAMLELLYSTGMQVAELLSLNVKDVNLTDHYVHCPGKGSKERIIPICGEAVQSLHKYLAEGRSQLALYNREEALFLNRFGKRLSRQGLWRILKGHAKAANLTAEITPRTIRHSFAARLISEGADLHTVQQRLGHVSSATTQAYSRFINKR